MIHDDIELSIRWSAETEDLGNEVWCSKPAADAILRLAKQKERLESRIQKLEAVAEAAKKLGCGEGASCLGHGFIAVEQALEELEKK